MDKCIDGLTHKFEPRYDTKQRVEEIATSRDSCGMATRSASSPVLEDKIFIYDICTKCGKKIWKTSR